MVLRLVQSQDAVRSGLDMAWDLCRYLCSLPAGLQGSFVVEASLCLAEGGLVFQASQWAFVPEEPSERQAVQARVSRWISHPTRKV